MGRDMYAYRGKFIHANCVPAWQSVIPSICAFARARGATSAASGWRDSLRLPATSYRLRLWITTIL